MADQNKNQEGRSTSQRNASPGAAGDTDAARRGGERSAATQNRDEQGQFAGREDRNQQGSSGGASQSTQTRDEQGQFAGREEDRDGADRERDERNPDRGDLPDRRDGSRGADRK